MNFIQLEYIIEVAKTGSITKAAENLHVSAATVSQSISNFEEQHRMSIFKRSRLGTVPTTEGNIIIEKAYEIKKKLMELEREVSLRNSSFDKTLKIISSSTILNALLPKALYTITQYNTELHIEIKEAYFQHIIDEMLKGEIDLGFVSTNEKVWFEWGKYYKNVLHFDTLSQGRMYVCVNKFSPLSLKDEVTLEDLVGQTLILYPVAKPVYDDIIHEYGPIKLLLASDNTEIIKNLVIAGVGITFLSDYLIKNKFSLLDDKIVKIPIVNYEKANITYGWVRSKKRSFSVAARDFIKIVRQQIAELE